MNDAGDDEVRAAAPGPWDGDPLEGTTAGRGELPPEELQSFNTVGHMGPAGDLEGAARAGRAGYDYLRDPSARSWGRVVPLAAVVVLAVLFLLPAVLR